MADLLTLIAGRYLLRELVGHGGMGRVWRALDTVLGREVAIKEVVPPHWLGAKERERLRELAIREARMAAKLNHEHVVRIFDVVEQDEWPWIVMEYVPSQSLHHVIEQNGPLDPLPVALIGLALLDALSAAHDAGVLHRDVKPLNVLISGDGRIVLTDFGLATIGASGVITYGTILGSPQFIAPERAMHGISSVQADLWSLGATMYAAVEGRSPYARESVTATLVALATQPPDATRRAGPLRPILEGLLCREPDERMTPAELRRALMRLVDNPSALIFSPPARTPSRRSRPVAALMLVALLAVPSPRPSSTTASTKVDTLAYTAPVSCDYAPTAVLPIPEGVAGPPQSYRLMDGWIWFAPAGSRFAVAVPSTWEYWRTGDAYCFQDRHAGRVLGIDASETVQGDPAGVAGDLMTVLLASGTLPGYRLIGVSDLQMTRESVQWEFSYSRNGFEHRAVMLFIGVGSSVHIVFWATDVLDFQPSRAYLDVVRGSYTASAR